MCTCQRSHLTSLYTSDVPTADDNKVKRYHDEFSYDQEFKPSYKKVGLLVTVIESEDKNTDGHSQTT